MKRHRSRYRHRPWVTPPARTPWLLAWDRPMPYAPTHRPGRRTIEAVSR